MQIQITSEQLKICFFEIPWFFPVFRPCRDFFFNFPCFPCFPECVATLLFLQKPTDLDLHCLQRQDISGFSRTRVNPYPAVHDNPYLCKQCMLKKPSFQDLHCLSFSFGIWMKTLYDVIWLADSQKWVWLIKLFSRIRVNIFTLHIGTIELLTI